MGTVDPFKLCADPELEKKKVIEKRNRLLWIQEQITAETSRLSELRERANQQQMVVNQLIADQQSICDHPNVEIESRYFEGSYYDHAYTEKRAKCMLCHAVGEWTRETHSWYG